MALAARIADDEVRLVDSLSLSAPKTSAVSGLLGALGVGERTVLVAPEKHDDNLWKSARNIEGVSVSPVGDLNAWTILRPRTIVMTTAAIDAFRAAVKAKAKPASAARKPSKSVAKVSAARKTTRGE
jgi:large subunit ribosomal protein L4